MPNSTKFATFAKSTESIFFSSSHIMIKYLLLTIMLLLASQAQDAFAQQKICKGTTSKGTKCTREAEPGYNFCYYHLTQDPNVKQCEAKTKKSTRCKFPAEKGSKYCKLHDPSAVKCKATTKKAPNAQGQPKHKVIVANTTRCIRRERSSTSSSFLSQALLSRLRASSERVDASDNDAFFEKYQK